MTEGRDWTGVPFQRCPDCGTDPTQIAARDLGPQVQREVAEWGRTLATADPAGLRFRPEPDVWSALEYACHTRDLLRVMAARVRQIRAEDDPTLGWWDHEAAVLDEGYNEQDPVLVLEAMGVNGRAFAATLAALSADEWQRSAQRRPGERFTVRGIGRFVLHEVIHHREDAERVLARVT